MTIKTAGITICAAMGLVCAGWGQNSSAQKSHNSTARPYHPSKDIGTAKRHPSAPAPLVSQKTQSARQNEVERLERQNSMRLQAQSRQTTSKKPPQVAKVRPETASKSSNINFSYHPPHTQSAGAGSHK